jgi:hypothetical protein
MHDWAGGGSGAASLAALPTELVSDRPVTLGNETLLEECFVYEYGDGRPITNMPYHFEQGEQVKPGNTDLSGETVYAVVSALGETTVRAVQGEQGSQRGRN